MTVWTALQFGAGNIGRGFMGQLFYETGYRTVFVDASRDLVSKLRERGRYTLRLLEAYTCKEIDMGIDHVDALHPDMRDDIVHKFAEALVVGTAVGINNLEAISPLIADGIVKRYRERREPVDIYLCENTFRAAGDLKQRVFSHLGEEIAGWAEENIGFVGTSVARMVPASSDRFKSDDPLFVVADSYHKLPYDGAATRAQPLGIMGAYPVRNFKAEMERKLYTHNLGHAVMGYLGYLKGYSFVHEPFHDDLLSRLFDATLDETSQALLKTYPQDLDPEEHRAIRADVKIRFSNSLLQDSVQRVARDPIRKLGPDDRLVGSAMMCIDHDIFPDNGAAICGAALCYDYPEDPEAVRLQKMLERNGAAATLREISHVEPGSELGDKIIESYKVWNKKKLEWRR
jgi:mannitol-1-phosphate 5-dehydrogenase